MRTADSSQFDVNRIRAAGFGGLTLAVVAIALALIFNEVRWFALMAVGGGVLAGAVYISYRRRQGPLDWDKHLDEKPESNFHHL